MEELVQIFKTVISTFQQYYILIITVLAVLGIGIDKTPWININPVKTFGKWVAKYLDGVIKESTKEISSKIDEQGKQIGELKKDIEKINKENISKDIYDMRWEILDFENAQGTRDFGEEMYNHIIDVHDKYETLISENNMVNGRVDVAYENILSKFRDKFSK